MSSLQPIKNEIQRFHSGYIKEALKEPANLWALGGFAVAAIATQSPIPLILGLVAEVTYLLTVPAMPWFRARVNARLLKSASETRRSSRERVILLFTSKEREAVEYLKWQKELILSTEQNLNATIDRLSTYSKKSQQDHALRMDDYDTMS